MVDRFSWTPAIVLIVVAVVAAGAGSAALYLHNKVNLPPGPPTVAVGDNVTVNYIGIFGSGPDSGRVFDTSLYSVSTNGAAYPKSLEFSARANAANYTPLPVHVGGNTPQAGYSLGGQSYIQVVTGFWQGLVGLQGNQTKAVVVPPALGYGPKNPSCIGTEPLSFQLPVLRTMPGTTFQKLYPSQLATSGTEFRDPNYGWNVLILAANASFVTIENLASPGMAADPSGWTLLVTNVTSTANGTGQITLVNQLNPDSAGRIVGTDYLGTGPCSASAHGKFIVTAVDLANGTYTADYNSEVTGQTLIFFVTVVNIFEPVAATTTA
ncbi:MAG: FKBP-type peptidyl-prolyl cis-trans isomerase [Thermoplasmata archaeon]|nr:FKBP-type peptidyl-prolyl cis-trans isomerase [Thermoplasmata archaeon]